MESVTFAPARSSARWPAVAALLASIAAAGCADSSTTTAPTTAGLASIVLSSSSVVGGTPVTATLTLTTTAPAGGAVVTLASSSAAVVVPASVTIPEGANTLSFSVATTSAAASTTITATYAGASQTATLVTTVVTVAALETVFLSNSVSVAGTQVQGTVTLTAPAPAGGLAVSLASSSPAASLPGSVVVPPGRTTATFPIEIGPRQPLTATITASLAGVTRTASLTIDSWGCRSAQLGMPAGFPTQVSCRCRPRRPDGGALIALTSNSPNATVPATVTIPQADVADFHDRDGRYALDANRDDHARTYGGSSQTATLRAVAYPNLVAMSCNPSTAAAGTAIQCSGTLGTPGSASGWRLALASSDPAVTAPPTVTLPQASTTFQFSLATGTVSSVTAVTVRITDADSGFTLWTVGISVSP